MLRLRTFGGLSLEQDGQPITGAASQRRRLALLAILATGQGRGVSRDKVLALLWPERVTERGSHALAQALYALRRDLGADPLAESGADLRLNPATISSDVQELHEALQHADGERAAALLTGPFLDGFFISDAPDFERWVDEERARWTQRARELFNRLAHEAARRGDANGAVAWWRRLAQLDPFDARTTIGLMEALEKAGDLIAALQQAGVYEHRLREELDAPADPAVVAAVKRLRQELAVRRHSPGPTSLQPAPVPRASRRGVMLAGGAAMIAVLLVVVALARRAASPAPPPLVAIGAVRDYSAGNAAALDHSMTDLLATNLARVPGLQVVSTSRMYELLGPPASDSAAAFARAARRAGAALIVEGGLYRSSSTRLRLDLRLTDLVSGAVAGAYSVEGRDAFQLVDKATAELAGGLRVRAPADVHVADATTRSLVAYRFYEAGLREFYQHDDIRTARQFFLAALGEDSTFAMAEYYAALAEINLGVATVNDRLAHAVRLADHASDRERLLIRGFWAWYGDDPARLVIAESLATRYPAEPDGHYLLGLSLQWGGDFLGAIPHLRRVVAMDSLGFRGAAARCLACDAMLAIATAYWYADSLPAAEAAAREWTRLQPGNGAAWGALADQLEYQGRDDEALTAANTGIRLFGAGDDQMLRARLAIRAGDFALADRLLGQRVRDDSASFPGWFLMISLRAQGRLREALAVARAARRRVETKARNHPDPSFAQPEAIVLFESGQWREAAELFAAIADSPGVRSDLRPRIARNRAWNLTHTATALAAAGDTAALAMLADSVQHEGARSAYGRDPLLHHYIRGLLLSARGRTAEAANEYRTAIFSTTAGYTRANYELARALLVLRRPDEAIAVLQPALRGSLEASNAYVTHTELHELLAEAFDAAHRPDSAAAHYARVVNAWQRADPQFQSRYAHAVLRLAQLHR
ncbi:MAG TPA: BTAD domain-containing putative transcriptional regulator [Gemmatimonadales bacterium]|jgi:DNA-binding SARP family transcriptional activator/TolB-like protein